MKRMTIALLAVTSLISLNLQAHAHEITSKQAFEKEINFDGVVVVKFSSTWCQPCKKYKPVFLAVATQHANVTVEGKSVAVRYLMVDVDKSAIANEYGISSIPTTIFFKNGKQVATLGGAKDYDTLLKKIKEVAQK